jgi:hypothetical protein
MANYKAVTKPTKVYTEEAPLYRESTPFYLTIDVNVLKLIA